MKLLESAGATYSPYMAHPTSDDVCNAASKTDCLHAVQVDHTEMDAHGMVPFANVTINGAKYEGPGILTLEEVSLRSGGDMWSAQSQ